MRFDQIYGVNILLRAELRNLMVYGSVLEVSSIIGQSPQVTLGYSTDRGKSLGIGTSLKYDNFKAYLYQGHHIHSSYTYNRGSWDLFLHSSIGNYNRLILGGEASVFSLSPIQSFYDLQNTNESYLSGYLTYDIDSWDKAYYPNKGFKFKLKSNVVVDSRSNFFIHHWIRTSFIYDFSPKFKIPINLFVGSTTASEKNNTAYLFELGGMANQRILWHNNFPGLRFLQAKAKNIWLAKAGVRYEFYPNHYLTYTYGLTALDNSFEDLFYNAEQFYTGMSLKYGFNSMFGPLEISIDYGFQSYYNHTFISLGYWF